MMAFRPQGIITVDMIKWLKKKFSKGGAVHGSRN